MDRWWYPIWEVVLGASDRVNIHCPMNDTCVCIRLDWLMHLTAYQPTWVMLCLNNVKVYGINMEII